MNVGDARQGAAPLGVEIGCTEAAALLDVPAAALQRWARELEFPRDVGDADRPRFRRAEVEALRAALPGAHSVCGAIESARRRMRR